MFPVVPETVTQAALRVDGEVWTLPRPARHCHLIKVWCEAHWQDGRPGPVRIPDHEQGFVTSTGRFAGREEAARIAFAAGQLSDKTLIASGLTHALYSEDLW